MAAVQSYCNCSAISSCTVQQRVILERNITQGMSSPSAQCHILSDQPHHAVLWSSVDSTVCQTTLWISSGNWFAWKITQQNTVLWTVVPAHLQKPERLHREGDVEKNEKKRSQEMHIDLHVKMAFYASSIMPLRIACWREASTVRKVWAGSTYLLSCPVLQAGTQPQADEWHQCSNSLLLPALPPPPCTGFSIPLYTPLASGTTTKAAAGFLPL